MKTSLLSLAAMLCALFSFAGEPGDTTRNENTDTAGTAQMLKEITRLSKIEETLKYQTGTVKLRGDMATVNVPKGFRFLGPEDTKKVLEDGWGNLKGQDPLGMIVPGTEGSALMAPYAYIISFEDLGYVKDDDADKINYDELMTDLKKDGVEANNQRRAQGLETIDIVGWALKPRYDKNAKILYWAKELRVSGAEENTLNYDVRILGRKGVLVMTAVASMSELDTVSAHNAEMLSMVSFNEGHRYSDFDSNTDKIAAWTIGGLVAGKVLAKVGFFAVILKFGKFIILGIVAIFGGLWRRITGKKKDDGPISYDPEPQPAPATDPQPETVPTEETI